MSDTQLEKLRTEKQTLERELASSAASDPGRLAELGRRHAEIEELLALLSELEEVRSLVRDHERFLEREQDPDLVELAEEELDKLRRRLQSLESKAEERLVPTNSEDARPAIVEIRAGTGGEEAALFAGDLFRMYTRFTEAQGWPLEVFSESATGTGGVKEVIFRVGAPGAYGLLRLESGVHRVQRIPQTETSGRIHTSTATVAVLPEAEEQDIQIPESELRIDVFRSSGHGGQSVNTTDSAVRITHLPTGMVVTCQDEKSQLKNKQKAMKVLQARLLAAAAEKKAEEQGEARRSQIGTGDRSEKIRTYNFPQDRLTDHRISFTAHGLSRILDGEIDDLLSNLKAAERAELGS